MYRIVIDLPYLAEGAELQLAGLGVFTVGGDNYVSDEIVEQYEQANITHEPAFTEDGEQVGMSQVRKTLPELLENLHGVSAEVVDDEEAAADFEDSQTPSVTTVTPSGDTKTTTEANLDLTNAAVPTGFPALGRMTND